MDNKRLDFDDKKEIDEAKKSHKELLKQLDEIEKDNDDDK